MKREEAMGAHRERREKPRKKAGENIGWGRENTKKEG